MTDSAIRVSAGEAEGRFHRQQLIEWWDQERLARAKALVIGAGALGNEVLKNLALVGVGAALVVDMDRIEHSNLSRSVLFRQDDIGRPKAEAAAERARELYPAMRVRAFFGNAVHDLGMGVFRWADVVLCGVDNREARVAINRCCRLVGRPWIDGGIERLDGVARVFLPDSGACYECTMNETDWRMLQARRSCALLSREQMLAGRTPTTATISAVIAGFMCQEMLKLLHGLPVAGGAGVVVNGQAGDVFRAEYPRKEDCMAHETLAAIVPLEAGADGITMAQLLARARSDLGPSAALELSREVLHQLECVRCDAVEPVFRSLGSVTEDEARCRRCGEVRFPRLLHALDGSEDFLSRSVHALGLPPYDIVIGRAGERAVGYLMSGDEEAALGPLGEASSSRPCLGQGDHNAA